MKYREYNGHGHTSSTYLALPPSHRGTLRAALLLEATVRMLWAQQGPSAYSAFLEARALGLLAEALRTPGLASHLQVEQWKSRALQARETLCADPGHGMPGMQ